MKYKLTEKVNLTESRRPDQKWKCDYILNRSGELPLLIGTATEDSKKNATRRAAQNALRVLRQRGIVV